ncbi:MAG TPA: carboxymethylenebutenolidase [Alphaproteobacteria bacterium]|nr:carboxymethylenebutenolidase [Alphaproteobacteria bacterium]HBA44137.1 carboxymethylenebutenolidase [Alphaproteobacteria bacterium]HBC53309.1 carboxymethylenebutenolidase [Alphaproteobacteria bacterium]HBF97782.1 carboxymethylenebutenolidase [Alphaproteobacteria bacterium]HCO89533.1 carboxymethylenebutenolidase [Alphaproteobacteria bacterium]
MSGEEITISTPDGDFMGYLSKPASGSGPGIVVIQEIFGVNQVMRDITDDFAAKGFVALCPDLFWRIEPGVNITDQSKAEWDKAFSLFGQFDRDKGAQDVAATITTLRGLSGCTGKVGTVGFCLGGMMAYLAATRTDADASVGYYGVNIPDLIDEAGNISNPLMLHIAGKDSFVPPEMQQAMHAGLDGNPHCTLHDYPEQDHAFARKGGEHYDAAAEALAMQRTLDFFQKNLK